MPDPALYYHYTSRHAAQHILACGYILPTPERSRIYLSPDHYTSGYEAANKLGIYGTPVEIAFAIAQDTIQQATAPSPVSKVPHPSDPALNLRQGDGLELTTEYRIPISSNPPTWFVLEAP